MSAACIEVRLFGEFSLSYKGKILAEKDYRSQKMWAVLAYLIMNRRRQVTKEELIQQFWDDDDGQNPESALKTLIFRLRKLLLPLLGEECQPIASTPGAYQWSSELPCHVDVDAFEELLHQCKSDRHSQEEQIECYRKALALYQGDFLPKAVKLTWHAIRSAYYQMQYSRAACEFAELLEQKGENEEMMRVCNRTLHQGVLEEKLYVMLIRGLLHQGNHTQALQQYELATERLYHELGVERPSDLKSLYQEIMNESMQEEPEIGAILEDMRDERGAGAFFCEYGFFREAYRMEARRLARSGGCAQIAVLTLASAPGKTISREVQGHAMKALKKALSISLRSADIAAQYSSRQYVILLADADETESLEVCRRVEQEFHRNWYHRITRIHTTVHAVEVFGKEGEAR